MKQNNQKKEDIFMKENLLIIKKKDQVLLHGKMDANIKVNLKIIKCMVMVLQNSQEIIFIKEK